MIESQGFHAERLGMWSDPVQFSVYRARMVAYAEATNDPILSHTDGTYAPPVFAMVAPFSIMADTTLYAVPDELIMRILHGEQDMRFHRPIVAGDELSCRAKVIGIHGKSSGVVVTTLVETRDAARHSDRSTRRSNGGHHVPAADLSPPANNGSTRRVTSPNRASPAPLTPVNDASLLPRDGRSIERRGGCVAERLSHSSYATTAA